MSKTPTYANFFAPGSGNLLHLIDGNYYHSLQDWNYKESSVDYWRLYWNPRPGAELQCQKQHVQLNRSNVILVPPCTCISSCSYREFSHFFLHFYAATPYDRVKKQLYLIPCSKLSPILAQLKPTQSLLERQRFVYLQLAAAALLAIDATNFLSGTSPGVDNQIQTALKLIHGSDYPLSNADLCAKLRLAPSTFYLKFKAETGLSPRRYQLNMRLEKAAHRLLLPDLSIKEIADSAGFADRYHFSKAFKAFFNLSPAEFRRRNRSNLEIQRKTDYVI